MQHAGFGVNTVFLFHILLAHSRVWHHWCAWLVSTVLDVNRTFSMYLNGYRKKSTGYILTRYILLNDQRMVYHLFCRMLAFSSKLFIFLPCHSFRTITWVYCSACRPWHTPQDSPIDISRAEAVHSKIGLQWVPCHSKLPRESVELSVPTFKSKLSLNKDQRAW